MSNPGVILLCEAQIGNQMLRVEDNIGEAIHLHINNIRIDFTVRDFILLVDGLKSIAEKMINVTGFSFDKYDAIWLKEIGNILIKLKKIEYKEVCVDELRSYKILDNGQWEQIRIKDTRIVQGLNGDYNEIDSWNQTNYYGDSNRSRVRSLYDSIKKNGYNPTVFGTYIVVMDNGRIIIDGCHRASCIYCIDKTATILVANWITSDGMYSDAEIEKFYNKKNNELIRAKENLEKKRRIKYKVTHSIASEKLTGKRVIIKGAGVHTVEFLKLIKDLPVEIVAIIGDKVNQEIKDYPIIGEKQDLSSIDADVIFISSYIYRDDMHLDVDKYKNQFEIVDLYDEGIETEFYT